jgi:DNA-binding protein YbaB
VTGPPAGRPNWSALGQMAADLRTAVAGLTETQQQMLQVTAQAWSPDRMVRVVVGPRGQLVELEIDPRVYRKPNSKALAAAILAAAREATEQAMSRSREIMDGGLPSDLRVGTAGPSYVRRMMTTHDADLRTEFGAGLDDGGDDG